MTLCPWADAVYGCDKAWWQARLSLPILQNYKGMKVCWDGNGLGNEPGMIKVRIAPGEKGSGVFYSEELSFDTGMIGAAGNSGFQAMNLAINWGAKKIVLIGFDMHDLYGAHWYGRNTWPMANNPNAMNFKRWKDAFNKAAVACTTKGILVLNASKGSALDCFTKVSLEEAVKTCTT